MSQMVVQAMWDRDSPLKQIPHFTPEVVKTANAFGANDVFEFMDLMDPTENKDYEKMIKRLNLDKRQLGQAAHFTNDKYPNVEVDFEVEDPESITTGAPAHLNVHITRETDDEEGEPDTTAHAPFYPGKKMENWWLVVGEEESKTLLAIKRVTIGRKLDVRLEFVTQKVGGQDLKCFLMCDSYVGVDQDPGFRVEAAEGMEEEEDEDEGEGEEGDGGE